MNETKARMSRSKRLTFHFPSGDLSEKADADDDPTVVDRLFANCSIERETDIPSFWQGFYINTMTEAQKKALSEISEMKKTRRKISRLANDATDDEIIRWTKSNDVFDRLKAGASEIIEDHADLDAVLHEAIFQDNTAQLNMRLPPAMKAVLSKLARERTTDATTLAPIWLAERLERELKPG